MAIYRAGGRGLTYKEIAREIGESSARRVKDIYLKLKRQGIIDSVYHDGRLFITFRKSKVSLYYLNKILKQIEELKKQGEENVV